MAGWGDVLAALAVAAGVAALGVPLGWLWSVLAPRVEVVVGPLGPDLADYQTEAFIGADGTFAGIGAGTGVLLGAAGWLLLRRRRGPLLALGLVAGALAGAWVAMRTGELVGAGSYERLLAAATDGDTLRRPVEVRATGVLLVQAVSAILTYVVVAGWSRHPDLATGGSSPVGSSAVGAPTAGPPWSGVSSGSAAPGAPPTAPAPPATDGASSPPV